MISKIAALLRDEISGLNFVEIAAGLAKPKIVRVNNTSADAEEPAMIDKVIPMAYNDLGIACEEGDLYSLVPNTKKKSIVWWEDNGIELVEEQTYYYQARASLICVGWWNLPLINDTLSDASLLVANIIAAMPKRLSNIDYLSQIRVSWSGNPVSGAEVLSKYTFDEAENQFATFPFAVSAIEFIVDFAFGINCVDCMPIIASSCPPKMNVSTEFEFFDLVVTGTRKITVELRLPVGKSAKIIWGDEDCTVTEVVGGTSVINVSPLYSTGVFEIRLVGDYTDITYIAFGNNSGAGTYVFTKDITTWSIFTNITDLRFMNGAPSAGITGDISTLNVMTAMEDCFIHYTGLTGDMNVISNFPSLVFWQSPNTVLGYTTAVLLDYNDGIGFTITDMELTTAEIDQFFIDLDAAVTNSGNIAYAAGNSAPSAVSAAARASLIAKGWGLF